MTKKTHLLPAAERAPKPVGLLSVAILASLAAAALASVLFTWLADEVFEGSTYAFDMTVRTWVHQFATPTLTTVMIWISRLGQQVLIASFVILTVVFWTKKWHRAAWWLVLAVAGALVLDVALKDAFQRVRPVPFFGAPPKTFSFPSGHSLFSFCFYGVLAGVVTARIRNRPLRILTWLAAALLILAVGLSRIYLGVHYPSDVLAGYLAGSIWVATLVTADRVRTHRRRRHLAPR